jgi:predicted RNA binding protein YcfA (HicA-like mRNA interferase family)
MPRLPAMSGRDVVRGFEKFGWQVARSGNHLILVKEGAGRHCLFPITRRSREEHSAVLFARPVSPFRSSLRTNDRLHDFRATCLDVTVCAQFRVARASRALAVAVASSPSRPFPQSEIREIDRLEPQPQLGYARSSNSWSLIDANRPLPFRRKLSFALVAVTLPNDGYCRASASLAADSQPMRLPYNLSFFGPMCPCYDQTGMGHPPGFRSGCAGTNRSSIS